MIEIRALGPDDWALWRRLRLAALAEAPYAFGSRLADWQGPGDREERWLARLEVAGSHNLVAFLDGAPVGMASGVPTDDPGAVELVSMWVSPSARGTSVADRLVRAVVRWAAYDVRARVLRLSVTAGNDRAAALYLRNGFRYTGGLGDPIAGGAEPELVMERLLP